MWSILLIGYLNLSGNPLIYGEYTACFVIKNGRHNDMYYDEIGLCAQNTSTIIIFPNNINGRAYKITLKERKSSL